MSGFDNDVVYAKNADFTQADNQNVSESNGLVQDGQIWIGSTDLNAGGTHVNVGDLISSDGSVSIEYVSPDLDLKVASTGGVVVSAYLVSTLSDVTGDGTIFNPIFDSTYVNDGSSYDTSTGVFTAPSDGNYLFTIQLGYRGVVPANHISSTISARKNGGQFQLSCTNIGNIYDVIQGEATVMMSGVINLLSSETLDFTASIEPLDIVGSKVVDLSGGNVYSLLGITKLR